MKFRVKPSDEVSGFLDKGTSVTGELEFAGTLRIDGHFHGSIRTGDVLIIGEHAIVQADIKASEVEIHGQVCGRIEAKLRVEISASGRVRGDIHTPAFAMTPGAMLDGRLQMSADRPEETTVTTGPVAQASDARQERH